MLGREQQCVLQVPVLKITISVIISLINKVFLCLVEIQNTQALSQIKKSVIKVKCLSKIYAHKKETSTELANNALNRPRRVL